MRSTRMVGKAVRNAVLALTMLALAACGANNAGIFYFIEIEEKEIDNSLPNHITAQGMGKLEESTGPIPDINGDGDELDSFYYVSAGPSLWWRDKSGTDWSKMAMPSGRDFVTALLDYSADFLLYAGTLSGLYRFDGIVWSQVSDTRVDGKQIISMWEVNSLLWISVQNGSTYDLVNYDDGTTTWSTVLSGLSIPVRQVAHGVTDSVYVAVARSSGYVLDDATFAVDVADSASVTAASTSNYYGVFFNGANDTCFIATDNDKILSTTDVTAFTGWSAQDSGEDASFRQFSSISGDLLLVGSHEHGFFEMDNEAVGALARADDVTPSDLRRGSVRDFYIDTASNDVFAMTAGTGLWSAPWSVSVWAAPWTHE